MTTNSLQELYIEQLQDLYSAEQQIIKALPKMIEATQSDELGSALKEHLEVTKKQANRIEAICQELGEDPENEKCKGMEGLLAEGKEMMDEYKGDPALDAVLIAAAQKVEHYEIASYGTICAWAEQMGHSDARLVLQRYGHLYPGASERAAEALDNVTRSERRVGEAWGGA